MARLNVMLLILVIACALGVVTSRHKARNLYVELQKEKDRTQKMDVEWGQLQLEQSTLATPARVEKLASRQLKMKIPRPSQIRYIHLGKEMVRQP